MSMGKLANVLKRRVDHIFAQKVENKFPCSKLTAKSISCCIVHDQYDERLWLPFSCSMNSSFSADTV